MESKLEDEKRLKEILDTTISENAYAIYFLPDIQRRLYVQWYMNRRFQSSKI